MKFLLDVYPKQLLEKVAQNMIPTFRKSCAKYDTNF